MMVFQIGSLHIWAIAVLLINTEYVRGFQMRDVGRSESRLNAGPRSERRRSSSSSGSRSPGARRRRPRERPVVPEVFDGPALARSQNSNEDDALPLDLSEAKLRCVSDDELVLDGSVVPAVRQPAFEFVSLDSIVDGLSDKFNRDAALRKAVRDAIRRDVFDSTPAYENLPEKAASIMLLPDSSLQGSWRKAPGEMKRLTKVLEGAFGDGDDVPTGDEFMQRIGAYCGNKPSTHWIDIVGVQDRRVSHSWHLDTGLSPGGSKTVLWGFPPEDEYSGCGVFSHIVGLSRECHAPEGHPRMEPILFDGVIDEKHIVRPQYAPGRELILYRDIDVLHSSPDVAYRTSVMRFM